MILHKKRIILAITGASGAIYGVRALEMLNQLDVEVHLVISKTGEITLSHETGKKVSDLAQLAHTIYSPDALVAPIASGSFHSDGMLILPCSIKTLSAVANSYTDTLISRAADVCLKEGRPLLLGIRETPLHRGHLRLMNLAAEAGAIIFPPLPSFYDHPASLDDMINNTVGRMLTRIGLPNDSYHTWNGT
jgi:4-hydroxy-3-polyprenylbenzoate decarboxylase